MEFTTITKVRHAALWELSRRLGGEEAACQQVGVSKCTFGKWVRLNQCFPERPHFRSWNRDRWESVKENLESLTGQSIEELFPPALRKAVETKALLSEVEQVVEVPDDALLAYAESTALRLEVDDPSVEAGRRELREVLRRKLVELPYRERNVIVMRYGLDEDGPKLLSEVGKVLGMSKERVRQIEAKAIRKLQQSEHSRDLVGFLD